ncbi:MAG: cation transporting ATPase C-terminal domain-containing protein [Firmicutes bacterium]|nr:cation transporting ATPase C-terminal domain-containing protein [Bacillota bacterium]
MKGSASAYHAMSAESVLRELKTNAETGLSEKEARMRTRRFGANRIYEETRTSALGYLGYIASDLMLILLLLTVATAAVLGEATDASAIIPILVFSIAARTFAYIKARRYIESAAVTREAMPNVHVLRGGELCRVDMRRVALGDIVSLHAGDIVPADCRILSCENLSVYEKGITGVDGGVLKSPDETSADAPAAKRTDVLFAGSCVISGSARAVVFATADDTYALIAYGPLKMTRSGNVRLSGLLDRYSRIWGAVMTAVAFVLSILNFIFAERGIYEVFIMGVALAVAAMCEYYSAMGDIAVASGLSALSTLGEQSCSGAKVRCVKSIEALAELDAVIFPADGVITTDDTECRYVAVGRDRLIEGDEPREYEMLFNSAAASLGLYGGDIDGGEARHSSHTTAIYKYLRQIDYPASDAVSGCGVSVLFGSSDGELPFDTVLFGTGEGYRAYMNGDADEIISAAAYYMTEDGERHPITAGVKEGLLKVVSYHERRGAHVVAIALKDTPFHSRERLKFAVTDVTFVGILALYRALVPGCADAVGKCEAANIRLIMTGGGKEDALTARHAGIINGRDEIITGREFAVLSRDMKKDAAMNKKLLLGFDERQLAEFIDILQKGGCHAAYIEDRSHELMTELRILHGVGASFTLSDGTTFGKKRGKISDGAGAAESSEAMKLQADGIIPRGSAAGGGLPCAVSASAYSRAIYRNISSIFDYLITSMSARMFAVLYAVIFHATSLGAVQILIWGLIFDFFAVITIALERPDDEILKWKPDTYKKLSHPFSGIFPPLLYGILWATATLFVAGAASLSSDEISAVIFISVMLSVIVVLDENRENVSFFSKKRRINPMSIALSAAVAAAIVASVIFPPFAGVIGITTPTAKVLLLSLIPSAVLLAAYEIPILREYLKTR